LVRIRWSLSPVPASPHILRSVHYAMRAPDRSITPSRSRRIGSSKYARVDLLPTRGPPWHDGPARASGVASSFLVTTGLRRARSAPARPDSARLRSPALPTSVDRRSFHHIVRGGCDHEHHRREQDPACTLGRRPHMRAPCAERWSSALHSPRVHPFVLRADISLAKCQRPETRGAIPGPRCQAPERAGRPRARSRRRP
jgi:hypothetical protein